MERIVIDVKDFDEYFVFFNENMKMMDLYGKQYQEKALEIYEKIASIFNSSDFFTEMVEKRLHDKSIHASVLEEIQLYLLVKLYNFDEETTKKIENAKSIKNIDDKEVLEKINSILEDPKESAYFDIVYSITKNMFKSYIYDYLYEYIKTKEPALDVMDTSGPKDIPDCDFIIDRYHEFIKCSTVDATPCAPTINENGSIVIKKGDLYHGTKYSEEGIESISKKGLESGQIHGAIEDGETFFCIDFFKATKDSTAEEICKSGNRYTNGPNQIVFVIDRSNIEGPDAMFPNLTAYDAYDETTEKGRKAREIVNVAGLPLSHSTGASFLIGVPSCMISSIIVGSKIEEDPQKIEFLSTHFPKATIVSRTSGTVLRKSANSLHN